MTPRLYRVILPVTDIEAAEAFYTGLQGVEGQRVSPGRHYFDLGGTILAIYDPAADRDEPGDGWRHHENQYV
jgi:catechol 2,3-dioxygenase-like lactoylglutathione lyase family enzyme